MKIIIDNNILTKDNIKKLKNTNILDYVKANKIQFYASSKLLEQLFPYLLNIDYCSRKEIIDYLFLLLNGTRIFDSIANIANKEIAKARGKYQFIPCSHLKNFHPKILYNQQYLTYIVNELKKEKINQTKYHKEIKLWAIKNRNMIKELSQNKFSDLDVNISNLLTKRHFNNESINVILKIIKNINDTNLSTENKKNKIFENLFFLLMELDFLYQLKNQKKLIKDSSFFETYYSKYNEPSFTRNMIKITLYGFSYKVCQSQYKKKYDEDWINDSSYICNTYFTDALLTNDTKYLKDAFVWLYKDSKQIFTLDEFLEYV